MKVKKKRLGPRTGRRTYGGPPQEMRALLGDYVEWMLTRNYSEETVRTRANDVHRFLDWCDERSLASPTDVTQPVLERYQRWLYYHRLPNGQPLSFRTQHHRLTSIKGYFRWLTRTHRTLFNPASELELPKVGKRLPRDVLTPQEAEAVINQADVSTPTGLRDRTILETFYSTGIRRKELARLKLYDLDVARRTLLVQEGKGLKDRIVPVGERAMAWLETYITQVRPSWVIEPDEGYLFLTVDGQPYHRVTKLSEMVHRYMKQADIGKKGGCHVFRHTVATLMLDNGADIRFIQEMLGHSQLSTTQIYTQVSIQKLRQIHRATHPAELTWRDPRKPEDRGREAEARELLDALAVEAHEEDEPGDP